MNIGERIRKRRKLLGLTLQQVADAFGINRASVSEWESGKSKPNAEKLTDLARVLDTTVDHLLTGAPDGNDDVAAGLAKNYLSVRRARFRLVAGVDGYTVEYQDDDDAPPLYFRREWVQRRGFRAERLVALKVSGASMEPGLYDGDTIVVNLADTNPVDGEVFAVNYEGQCVIKRLKRDSGQWFLSSDNADKRIYPDKRCDENAQILGRVVTKQSDRI